MPHSIDAREVLISPATAALMRAEADAAQTDGLIFRPEWRPTPRTRSPTSQPQDMPPNEGPRQYSWYHPIINQLGLSGLQLPSQPRLSPLPAEPALLTTCAPPPPPPAPSVPASSLTPERPHLPQPQLQEDAVAKLVKENQDVFDKIINHPFPRALGNATASLDGFRYFMVQDKLYLETYTRLKMIAVASSPNFKDVEKFSLRHNSSIEYVNKLKEICISMLGIPESTIDTTLRSVELDASEKFYKASVQQEDALLGYYVVLLPCILSYWRIAERLMDDPSTVRNVVYHPAWTVTNYDYSSADKYTKFINENIMAKGGVDRWNDVFRTACQLEANLFNTGLKPPAPYHIIPDGTYFIRGSSLDSVVLAVQNIKGFLQSPLDKLLGGYFPGDAGSSVVGVNKTGGDNEKWHAVVTKDGYTFQNLGTGLYLGIATELDREEGRILQGVMEPYYWWINPVPSDSSPGSLSYQIYDSVNLKYTLHADIDVLKSVRSTNFRYTPIIARENFQASCQMWSFNDELDPLECTGNLEHTLGEEASQAKTKAFDMMKGLVALSSLDDVKIVGGYWGHIDATIVAHIFNSSAIDVTVSSSVEMSYDQARIGYAELMGLCLHPGNNVVPLNWKLQPRSDVSAKVRDFINQYIVTSKKIPVLLHAKIANITISDQQRSFHDLETHSHIQGIGSRFVSRVDAYTGVGLGLLRSKSINFKFVFENPLDTPVTIHDFVVEASIHGTQIIQACHAFDSFTVPGKAHKQTPSIPDAHLVQGYTKTLRLIAVSRHLDVAITAATVSVGSFRLEALQFNLTNVPFSVSI